MGEEAAEADDCDSGAGSGGGDREVSSSGEAAGDGDEGGGSRGTRKSLFLCIYYFISITFYSFIFYFIRPSFLIRMKKDGLIK